MERAEVDAGGFTERFGPGPPSLVCSGPRWVVTRLRPRVTAAALGRSGPLRKETLMMT